MGVGCVGVTSNPGHGLILAPDGERVAWSGTILASACLDLRKKCPKHFKDRRIEMFRLGHKKSSCKQNATHVFLPEYRQYRTRGSLRRRARGAGGSWDMDAGCTLAVVLRGWKIPASQFRVRSSPEVLQAPLQ